MLRGHLPVSDLAAMPRIRSMHFANNEFSEVEVTAGELAAALRSSKTRPHSVEVNMMGMNTHLFEPSGW